MALNSYSSNDLNRCKAAFVLVMLTVSLFSAQLNAFMHSHEHTLTDQAEECTLCKPIENGSAVLISGSKPAASCFKSLFVFDSQTRVLPTRHCAYVSRAPPPSLV